MDNKLELVKIFQEKYLLPLFMSILLAISILPLLYEFFLPSPGKIKLFWHNYPYDFTYYRSAILQGYEGNFLTEDRYTTEPHRPIFIRPFYLFLGHLSRLLKIDPTLNYHLSRIFWGAAFLLMIVWFIQHYFEEKDKRFIAYLLTFLVGGFPKDNWTFLPHLTELQITRRITFLPHFLLGHIALILLILFLVIASKNKTFRFPLKFLSATIFLGLAGLNHPSSLTFFYPFTAFFIPLLFLAKFPLKTKLLALRLSFMALLILYPFMGYLIFNLTKPPWNLIYGQKFSLFGSLGGSFFEYLLALGPTAFLAIADVFLTFILVLRKQKIALLKIAAVSWFTASNLLVLLAPLLNFYAETRFTQVAIFLPTALLATDFLFFLGKKIAYQRIFAFAVALSLIFITLPAQISLYQEQFAEVKDYSLQRLAQLPYPPVADYPPEQLMEAILWLGKHSRKNEIVLSQFYAGNLIPAYAGNFVYLGHNAETINFEEKSEKTNYFFSTHSSEQIKFLKANNIRYIFYGPQEKSLGKLSVEELPILPVFQNGLVTIFEVKNEV